MNVRDQIIGFEGWKNRAYPDPLTHGAPWTCGVGATGPDVTPTTFWTDAQVGARLDHDLAHATAQVLSAMPWSASLSEARQAVLIGMVFQMGLGGLVAFHHALTAASIGDFDAAAEQMLDSLWARQTPGRAHTLAEQMRTGEWPHAG